MDDLQIKQLAEKFGDAFYILDSGQFCRNFLELKEAFASIYPHFNIAYSYKTNYIPKLCKIVDELGGYAEVVSDMEMEIALRAGVSPEKIIWNGPYKNEKQVECLLLAGGTVNIDSACEIAMIREIAGRNRNHRLNIGVRVNFDIGDGVVSRFGFDTASKEYLDALKLEEIENVHIAGLQCHFASRALETWRPRVEGMLKLADGLGIVPGYIDLGGGLFGKMADSLKAQFTSRIPTYVEYAETAASVFAKHFSGRDKPLLLVEPGSALAGDCMHFASRVVGIKNVRGKAIATLLGSVYNINPTLNGKNPPIKVYPMGGSGQEYTDLDFGGFTCIESDYLYRHYSGWLAAGDMVVFGNVGSYSVVLKPPFILPNFPVVDIGGNPVEVVKRGEVFDDLFHTFEF